MGTFTPEEMIVLEGMIDAGKLSREDAAKALSVLGGAETPPKASPQTVYENAPKSEIAAPRTPETVGELTGGVLTREALTMIGGIGGGAVAGLPGGGLGAAAGSTATDAIENYLRRIGRLAGQPASLPQTVERATQEGLTDAAFGAAGPVVWRWLNPKYWLGKISGINTQAARSVMADAELKGLKFGASEVGGRIPGAYLRTVSVFPFASGPAVKIQVAKQAQINDSVLATLNDLAPNAALTADLGVDLAKAATKTSDEFKRVAGVLYDEFDTLAKNASVKEIVPTKNARETAMEMFGEIKAGTIAINGKALKSPQPDTLQQFEAYIADIQNLPENITIEQYRRLTKDLGDIYGTLKNSGVDVRRAGVLKMALEKDLNEIRADLLPAGEATAIKSALQTANNWFSKGIVQFAGKADVPPGFKGKQSFETTTAGKFGRADKNMFRAGGFEAGSIDEDELYKVAVNLKSPQAVADLRALVGDDTMRKVGRKVIEDAYKSSLETVKIGSEATEIINPHKLEQALGLAGRNVDSGQGLRAVLKIGNHDIERIREVLDLAKKIEGLGDPSTFVRRRAMLGGASGILKAAGGLGGAAAAGAMAGQTGVLSFAATAGAVTLLSRAGSRIFTSPKSLKAMVVALDPGADIIARRQAIGRVLKYLSTPDGAPGEEKPGSFTPGVAPPIR